MDTLFFTRRYKMTKYRILLSYMLAMLMCLAGGVWAAPISSQRQAGSSTGAFTAPIPATKSENSVTYSSGAAPFVLMSGYFNGESMNFSGNTKMESRGPGFHYCKQGISSTYPRCYAEIKTGATRKCPDGFTPFVKISPIKTVDSAGTPTFACIYFQKADYYSNRATIQNRGVYEDDAGKYAFFAQMNAVNLKTPRVSTSNPQNPADELTLAPAVSFEWDLMCYPSNNTPPLRGGGSCSEVMSNMAMPILFWDMGNVQWPNNWTNAASDQTITTNRACPAGYKPYATITAGIPRAESSSATPDTTNAASMPGNVSIMHPSGVCVKGTSATGSTITYLARNARSRMTFSASSLTVYDPQVNADIGVIEWKLYCYPPGFDPPAYSTRCSTTDVYFKSQD